LELGRCRCSRQPCQKQPSRKTAIRSVGKTTSASEWTRLGSGKGHGFVDADGEPVVRAKVASGIARTNGEVEVTDDLPGRDALVAAVIASFLLIRKAEDEASAAAGSVAVMTPP
jgi:hypothetical protein